MRFTYKGNDYELAELKEPNKNITFDIIAIFKVKYCECVGFELKEVSKETYEASDHSFMDLEYINYFYGTDNTEEAMVKNAQEYIDRKNQEDK